MPGGFGQRGIEGKISAIKFARENKVPFFGICLGMQLACVEFARNVAHIEDAHSGEVAPEAANKIIDILPNQLENQDLGGTLRLGLQPCVLQKNTRAYSLYMMQDLVEERHRHRYEFNNEYREILVDNGLVLSGLSPDEQLVEIVELKDHPFFIACQFHPEFISRPNRPHPLFSGFVEASVLNHQNGTANAQV